MELEVIRPKGNCRRKKTNKPTPERVLHKKRNKNGDPGFSDIAVAKRRALLKLLLCEEDLLNAVLAGKEHFITPLRSVHEKHVQHLRRLTQGTEDNVGRLYQKQVDERFSVLRKYVSGLTLAKVLYKYKTINKTFREFVEEIPRKFTLTSSCRKVQFGKRSFKVPKRKATIKSYELTIEPHKRTTYSVINLLALFKRFRLLFCIVWSSNSFPHTVVNE
ncbi:uncharacterized protein CEXT_423261 [Caerostris extrusa]|uniref:Uncharacterized protein n=1 Tax=Caerostris extrusa TaxID=172846 RepID=A0AAV4TDQ9_CAEEX|nr:uncharacterized protein CEXT_423261 [Caerostris extrusa]